MSSLSTHVPTEVVRALLPRIGDMFVVRRFGLGPFILFLTFSFFVDMLAFLPFVGIIMSSATTSIAAFILNALGYRGGRNAKVLWWACNMLIEMLFAPWFACTAFALGWSATHRNRYRRQQRKARDALRAA